MRQLCSLSTNTVYTSVSYPVGARNVVVPGGVSSLSLVTLNMTHPFSTEIMRKSLGILGFYDAPHLSHVYILYQTLRSSLFVISSKRRL